MDRGRNCEVSHGSIKEIFYFECAFLQPSMQGSTNQFIIVNKVYCAKSFYFSYAVEEPMILPKYFHSGCTI